MRRIVLLCVVALLLLSAGCSPDEQVVITAGTEDDGSASATVTQQDTPSTTGTSSTSTTLDVFANTEANLVDYLLTADDLPGWTHVRQMRFPAEPTYEAPACELMGTAWSAHATAGTRIRASTEAMSIRQTVVQMPDSESAEAIIDAADVVWQECNPLTLANGDDWWVEPIDVPDVDGWRTSGVALGMSGDLIWSIAWFQQGSTVVFMDLDSVNPWPLLEPVLQTAARRITGQPSPLQLPGQRPDSSTTTTVPTTSSTVRPTSTTASERPTSTTSAIDESWREHPAANYMPDATLFGDGYVRDRVAVQVKAPGDPDDLHEECPVNPPPIMDGLEMSFDHESDAAEVEVAVGIGDAVAAQENVDAFRAFGACGAVALEADELTVINPESAADDAVILEALFSHPGGVVQGYWVAARYDDVLVGVAVGVETSSANLPSATEVMGWADSIAASG